MLSTPFRLLKHELDYFWRLICKTLLTPFQYSPIEKLIIKTDRSNLTNYNESIS